MSLHELTTSLLFDDSDTAEFYEKPPTPATSPAKKKKKKHTKLIFAVKLILVIILCVLLVFGVIVSMYFLAYSAPALPEFVCTYSADVLYTTKIISTGAAHTQTLRLHSVAAPDGSGAAKYSEEPVSPRNGTRAIAHGGVYYTSEPFFDRRLCTKGYWAAKCPAISSLAVRAEWTAPCPSDPTLTCSVYTRSWDPASNETWYVFLPNYGGHADKRVLSGYYLYTGDIMRSTVFTNYTFAAPAPSHFEFNHSDYCYEIHGSSASRFAYNPALRSLVPTSRAHDLINSPPVPRASKLIQNNKNNKQIKNQKQRKSSWVRGDNPCFDGLTYADMRQRLTNEFLGSAVAASYSHSQPSVASVDVTSIPEAFDCEDKWPSCGSLGAIRDQGECRASWAFGVAEVLADRTCIATGANLTLSPQYLMDCVSRRGCLGWAADAAWEALAVNGTTTEACTPYVEQADLCADKCADGSQRVVYRSRGAHSIYVEGNFTETVRLIQLDIMENGPVAASMFVYDDLYKYRNGVYYHDEDAEYAGKHVVKIVGWGTDEESGLPYWKVANSWSTDFGENGYFRILRGKDESGIEYGISAGYPVI